MAPHHRFGLPFRDGLRGMMANTSAASRRVFGLALCMSLPARLAWPADGLRGAFAIDWTPFVLPVILYKQVLGVNRHVGG